MSRITLIFFEFTVILLNNKLSYSDHRRLIAVPRPLGSFSCPILRQLDAWSVFQAVAAASRPAGLGSAARPFQYNPHHASFCHRGDDRLALGLAGGGGFSGRGAERRGRWRLVSLISGAAGHGDSAGAGQRHQHRRHLAGPAHLDRRLPRRRAPEPAPGCC